MTHEPISEGVRGLVVGDVVTYRIPRELRAGHGTVIGHMTYGDDVCCLADEVYLGMPINVAHCRVTGKDVENAYRWRRRYLATFPDSLAALQAGGRSEG